MKCAKENSWIKKEFIQTWDDNTEVYIHYQKGDNEAFEQQELSRDKEFLLRSWLFPLDDHKMLQLST